MGVVVAEIVDRGDDIAGPLPLTVEQGIGWLVAEAVAQRVDAGNAEAIGQRVHNAALLPAGGVHQQPVLQDHQRAGAIDRVVDSLSAIADEGHIRPLFQQAPAAGFDALKMYRLVLKKYLPASLKRSNSLCQSFRSSAETCFLRATKSRMTFASPLL
jgi:hypothetical protein